MTIHDINDIIKAVCSNSEDYEKPYISPKHLRQKLEQLALEQEQRMLEPTTKNDLAVDCVSRQFMYELGATCIASRDEKGNLIALGTIEGLPSATPQEPRKGHWIPIYQGDEIIDYRCSECEFGNTFGKETIGMNYCPNCGADMRKVEE